MVEILQPDRSNFICISKIYITRHEFQFQASFFSRLIIFQRLLLSFILITWNKHCQCHFIVRFLKNKYILERKWSRSCNQIDQILYMYIRIHRGASEKKYDERRTVNNIVLVVEIQIRIRVHVYCRCMELGVAKNCSSV